MSLRALLYVPAGNAGALAGAGARGADALIIDLEDSVAPNAKPAARAAAVAALAGGFPVPAVLRVNAAGTPWHEEDMAAARAARPSAMLVPKVERAADAAAAVAAGGGLSVWAMIETPAAVLAADAIAGVPGVAALVGGWNDLAAATGARVSPGRAVLAFALQRLVLAARAGGAAAYDGVPMALTDAAAIAAECAHARALGFDGKTLVHPAQIAPCLAAFTPDAAEVADARAVLAAWEARPVGAGVAVADGRLVEEMHVVAARRTLANFTSSRA